MAVLFLVLSVAAAALATVVIFLVFKRLQDELETARTAKETVAVVVAAHELHQGRTLRRDDVRVVEIPPEYLPDTVYRSVDEVLGRTPSERILNGELLRKERLAKAEAGVGLNAIIPSGKRALSIDISNGPALSGFLNPGNYVDILLTLRDPEQRALRTITMLQAMKVIAVGNRLGLGADSKVAPAAGKAKGNSITLEVTPEEAQKIIHAHRMGDLVLTLRNDIDVTHQETHGARTNELIGRNQIKKVSDIPQRPTAVKKKDDTLMIIEGRKAKIQKVGSGN